jgi:hypothetical protein
MKTKEDEAICMNVRACMRERAGAEIHITSIK